MLLSLITRRLGAILPLLLPLTASAQSLDFVTTMPLTVLDTDSTVIQPTSGPPITVNGGVFRFRNVTISASTTLRAVGSRPMVWLVETMTIDGLLDAGGSDGQKVNTLNSANFSSLGGAGGPAAGRGGAGSPQLAHRSFAGQSGQGPGRAPGFGGSGGVIAGVLGLPAGRGSGGGGGAFATTGDPSYPVQWPGGTSFVQVLGLGGYGHMGGSGSASRTLPGGGPGGMPFIDGNDENDFFGTAVDVFRNRIITGELALPTGGSGGGGGGDLANTPGPLTPQFVQDPRGGGGGGGGGCLVIYATNSIIVGPAGRVAANGGNGGGGEQAGSCNQGGGGGAGSGGMIVLAAENQIELEVKGETLANLDYDFVLSADGGVCLTGAFLAPHIARKYPANGQMPVAAITYDTRPLGGFGGMGIVQLVTRPGNNADGTNTALDDNITVRRNGQVLVANEKRRYLAWRGFKNSFGVRVDDFGVPTNIGANEGDIRPAPILMPLFP